VSETTVGFLADLTVALVLASILGAVARKLGLTPILGYVVAGIAIGPFTPGYQAATGSLGGLSELGLILLLFSLGLGFSISELRGVGVVPMAGNVVLMAIFCAATWALGHAFGFAHPTTLGLTFTLSSTAIGVALLKIFGLIDKRPGHVAVALLVAQDLIAVLILVVTTEPAGELTPMGALVPLLKAAAFVVVALVLGATVLHRIVVNFLLRAPTDALIAFCTAVALVAAWLGHLAGLSFEFGAFVAGAVTSEAAGSRMVQSIVAPFRELFVMIFFVSIGTLVDVHAIAANWPAIVVIGTTLTIVRWLGWFGLSRLSRESLGTATALGIALVPLGEFNVVLANDSFSAHRLDSGEYATAIGATLLTIVLAAVATRIASPRLRALDAATASGVEGFAREPEVLIIGYGRVGRTVGAICSRAGIDYAVIENDVELVHAAERDGAQARYGDGGDPRVVESAIARSTRVVLSTIPDTGANAALARRLSQQTNAYVIARAQRVGDIRGLRDAGANDVLVPEAEGAYGFAEAVLQRLGVVPESVSALVTEHRSHLT
jgi:monovalent cation:H+ antiporter-2, CPA2 family